MILAISNADTIYFRHLAIAVSWNFILLFEKSLAFIRFFIVTLFVNFYIRKYFLRSQVNALLLCNFFLPDQF